MGLLDNLKAQADVGLAKAAEAGRAGQAKLDELQARRAADGLLRSLGADTYAEYRAHPDRPLSEAATALVEALEAWEAEHGSLNL